jgi:hypothetical protein
MASLLMPQAPSAVVMVRPHHFTPNPQTASDNAFQRCVANLTSLQVAQNVYEEVSRAAHVLENHGVTVHLFEDIEKGRTPDSVFPNNWFSTHAGGHVALYPMYSPNRRLERRADVIELLKSHYRVQDVIDYSGLEPDGLYLEGTGAMVLDHLDRVAYTVRSNRANPIALERFATHFNYEPMAFEAVDDRGDAVYHTNVLMCIATEFVMVGFAMIRDPERREEIRQRLRRTGRSIVELTNEQIGEFAGNAIELNGSNGRLLALSSRALASLTAPQRAIIEAAVTLVPLDVPTIELAGGSVRCMLAGVHLASRNPAQSVC